MGKIPKGPNGSIPRHFPSHQKTSPIFLTIHLGKPARDCAVTLRICNTNKVKCGMLSKGTVSAVAISPSSLQNEIHLKHPIHHHPL